ncbi:Eco57I restriction-modification methylase domain-containing protein [Phocaeicola sp.]|uniref:Eco57I restriction-modification methylase domain-containing protein n=1 Tax=Phocaeicola sp. TaxID=2773926 RepID=UPI003AB687D6
MISNKKTGSYYTPIKTVRFMYKYLESQKNWVCDMLEPSAGDGRFIEQGLKNDTISKIVGVELVKEKAEILLQRFMGKNIHIISKDFLEFSLYSKEKYDLIIGNPPYINKKNIEPVFVERAYTLCKQYNLPKGIVQNAWVAFILASLSHLAAKGVLFFVLPIELLQVQYAEKLRVFLEKNFNTIHILTFDEKMFPEIEQNTCLLYLTNCKEKTPYIDYKQYKKLDSEKPYSTSKIQRNKPLEKWTNAILSDDEIDVLRRLSKNLPTISEFGNSAPGIVTGANNVFILTKAEVKKIGCEKFVIPIISRSNSVQGHLYIDEVLIKGLEADNRVKLFLLNLSGIEEKCLPPKLIGYLKKEGNRIRNGKKIKDGYKCSRRKPWYAVPIVPTGEVVFFKRYDKVPRICVKSKEIYTTDIAYNMRLKLQYDADSFVFCFYNSCTLALCEYWGRYYAGGVSELTPTEFKKLCVPYEYIDKEKVEYLRNLLLRGASVDEVVSYVDNETILKEFSKEDVNRLKKIRKKLMYRRLS